MYFCACGDLWFDEIWSFEWSQASTSPWDLLTRIHHDNNHVLNSLWLKLMGGHTSPLIYRSLSLGCGVASLLLIRRLSHSINRDTGWISLLLTACSFPLILYFSEARGYAPAIACGLACTTVLMGTPATPSWGRAAIFWFVCAAGILAHATFLTILLTLGLWKLVSTLCCRPKKTADLAGLPRWFLAPALFSIAFYLIFIIKMEIGGGPKYPTLEVLGQYSGYALGLPVNPSWSLASIAFFLLTVAISIVWAMPGKIAGIKGIFIILPISAWLTYLVARPSVMYFRYFIVILPFFYICISCLLAKMIGHAHAKWRYAACIALICYIAGQTPHLTKLATLGRGGYQKALAYIAENPDQKQTVTSDHDFRNRKLIDYYVRQSKAGNEIHYVPRNLARRGEIGWLILHTQDEIAGVAPKIYTPVGPFELAKTYPYAGVSGWNWIVYRYSPQ